MSETKTDPLSTDPLSLGNRLSKARKSRGWTLGYVAAQLHLPEATLECLEADSYAELPAEVYVKGYLRNYARLLRLPPDEIVDTYVEQYSATTRAAHSPARTRARSPSPMPLQTSTNPAGLRPRATGNYPDDTPPRTHSSAWLWVAIVFAFAYALTWWWPEDGVSFEELMNGKDIATESDKPSVAVAEPQVGGEYNAPDRRRETETNTTPSAASLSPAEATREPLAVPETVTEAVVGKSPADTASATPTASEPAGLDQLVLRFTGDSWATVIDAEGNRLLFQTVASGTTKNLTGKAPFKLTLGRVANVEMKLNGQAVVYPDAKNRATVRFAVPLTSDP